MGPAVRITSHGCIQKASWLFLALAFVVSSSMWMLKHKSHNIGQEPLPGYTCTESNCVVVLRDSLSWRQASKEQCDTGSAECSLQIRDVTDKWSLTAWVRLDNNLDDLLDTTAISLGPVSLKYAAPAVPYVAVEAAWPEIRRRFVYKQGFRAHCADLAICSSQTALLDDALQKCAQLPGCTVITRNLQDHVTYFCQGAYSIETRDSGWDSAVMSEMPPSNDYAVAVKSWSYLTLTYDSGVLLFYVNGVLRQMLDTSVPVDFTRIDVGWSARWFEGVFPGDVGNLRVWRRKLQHNEVVMTMSIELPASDHILDVTPSAHWTAPVAIKSGWTSQASANQPYNCAASVVVPFLGRTPIHQLRIVASHLQQHAGDSCQVNIFLVACARQDFLNVTFDGIRQAALLQPSSKLQWDACVRYGLQQAMTRDAESPYIAVVAASLLPLQGWLSGLVSDLQQRTDVSAVFSKILWVNGTIKSFGSRFEQAYDDCLARQVVRPVEMYAGYPWNYGPTMKTVAVQTADCSAWLMRSAGVSKLLEDGSFLLSLGSYLACSDMALRLQQAGRSVLVSPLSNFIDTATRARQEDPAALQSFDQTWGPFLKAQYVSGLALSTTVTWVMHCGGFAGIEAFNLVQHLEGKLRLRAQMQRGWPFCEHPDVLQDMPRAFSERVYRLRRLSSYLPSDIVIHHKDYRQLAAWPWPPNNSSAYLIGRYSWDLDRIHRQWAEHIKSELDEVWVPSKWHAKSLLKQGIQVDKIIVVPESIDSHLYDPDIWDPLTLPRQRKLSFLASFCMDDHAGWQAVLVAYLKAFRNHADVSLYMHTASRDSQRVYRRDLVYEAMHTFLHSSNDTYLQSISLYPEHANGAPHVYVFGQELTQLELARIYSSVDVVVVPSRSEGWDAPYMKAMSLGKPLIASIWGGLAEYIQPDFAFLLNYTIAPVRSLDDWVRGANWAQPSVDGLLTAFRNAYGSKDLRAMGQKARWKVVEVYDNEVVSNMILERLKGISESRKSESHSAKPLDMAKDPLPADVQMCSLLPKAGVRLSRTTPALKIAVVSTAPPRRCGIATFNSALMEYLQPLLPQGSSVEVFPLVWDTEMPVFWGKPAMPHPIRHKNYGDYIDTAHLINGGGFHAAILQHEFGIWGGTDGSFVVCFAKMLRVPVVSVIHTLSDNLQDTHQYILQHLAASSKAVVVMSESSRNKLGAFHGIPSDNVVVLPHGAPVISAVNPVAAKAMLNLTGRTVIMTNGLINPMKGIDVVLKALPEIVKEFPSVMYLIVGEPHPDCGKPCADYFEELVAAASDHRIANHVRFVTKFLDNRLLLQYVQAADIYVLPYKDRITTNSGTLTMALAAGKAVVSTSFDHAASVLPGRGVLVDFDSPLSLQDGILELLRDDSLRTNYQRAAREFSLGHDWRSVAGEYVGLLTNITAFH
ncbi:hypothetical protein VaNZ11_010122 [Volvox africanus]|uniref:Glycosyl transferase family 1 domain-containing protein n=1 Tax=Volvox africanus TaxID=51714 RepID=A0ABQ5S981_9CHLO|nr:hypothetical protein VaNZ11_010122 [Volvox africanus]